MVAVCCLLSTGLVLDALVREVKSSPQWAAFEACLKEIERRCSAVVVVLVVSYGSCPLCFTSLSFFNRSVFVRFLFENREFRV